MVAAIKVTANMLSVLLSFPLKAKKNFAFVL
jgi:hypothetical protein